MVFLSIWFSSPVASTSHSFPNLVTLVHHRASGVKVQTERVGVLCCLMDLGPLKMLYSERNLILSQIKATGLPTVYRLVHRMTVSIVHHLHYNHIQSVSCTLVCAECSACGTLCNSCKIEFKDTLAVLTATRLQRSRCACDKIKIVKSYSEIPFLLPLKTIVRPIFQMCSFRKARKFQD